MAAFDYNAEAELFPNRGMRGRPVGYRRFNWAADAIRFAIEELPPQALIGAWFEVSEENASMLPKSAGYTTAPPIHSIVGDLPWPIENSAEIAKRESREGRSPNSP